MPDALTITLHVKQDVPDVISKVQRALPVVAVIFKIAGIEADSVTLTWTLPENKH